VVEGVEEVSGGGRRSERTVGDPVAADELSATASTTIPDVDIITWASITRGLVLSWEDQSRSTFKHTCYARLPLVLA
jgi:hypothetical protein